MTVSVCMITYKQARYLAEAIKSILMQQTKFEVELVVANDNSPDDTDAVVKEIITTHPRGNRIKYLRNEKNLGMTGNFISAVEQCKGEYIAICDGDDFWTDPQKLQIQFDFLNSNPDYVLAFHDAKLVDESGKLEKSSMLPESEKRDFTAGEAKQVRWIPTLTICYRNVLKQFPPEFFNVLNLDTFLFSLLGAHGKFKYQSMIEPAAYRIHSGGIWAGENSEAQRMAHADTYKRMSAYYRRIGDETTADYYKQVVAAGLERILAIAYEGNDFRKFKNAYVKYLKEGKAYLDIKKFIYLNKLLIKFLVKRTMGRR